MAQQGQEGGMQLPQVKQYIDGVPFTLRSSANYMDMVHKARAFNYKPTDVVMAGYPRSGTTLSRAIVWLIVNDADVETFRTKSQIDRLCNFDYVRGDEVKSIDKADTYADPRILFSHLPYKFVVPNAQKTNTKVIYCLRNPKDVLLSLFHASRTYLSADEEASNAKTELNVQEIPFELVMKFFCSPNADRGPIWQHALEFWEHKDDPNIYFNFYEDMIADRKQSIRNLAKFLEKELTEEQVDIIAEETQVKKMKSTYANIKADGFDKKFNEGGGIRKGVAGGWRNEWTDAQNEWFDSKIEPIYKSKGLNFQY